MDKIQIEQVFKHLISKRGISEKLEGISKDDIYNWRKGRGRQPHIGDMLNVLYQAGVIKVELQDMAIAQANLEPSLMPTAQLLTMSPAAFLHKSLELAKDISLQISKTKSK